MRAISSAVVLSGISLLFALIPVFALPSTPEGCFSSSDPLQDQGPWTFQSLGYCQDKCTGLQKAVMAMKGANCWCGDEIPANSTKVADSKCNIKCNGFPSDICKSISLTRYDVWLLCLILFEVVDRVLGQSC